MRLYLHYKDHTLIIHWNDDSGTLSALRELFVKRLNEKHGIQLNPTDLTLVLPGSTRPLDMSAKVMKIFKDRDDVNVIPRSEASVSTISTTKRTTVTPQSVYRIPSSLPKKPADSATTAAVAAVAKDNAEKKLESEEDIYKSMPPLEPDKDDEYAHLKPPPRRYTGSIGANIESSIVKSIIEALAKETQESNPPPPQPVHDEDDEPQAEPAEKEIEPENKNLSQLWAPCSVCTTIIEFDSSADIVPCKACGTTNVHLKLIDAQTDCSRCNIRIRRLRGSPTMKCPNCSSELIVVKCPKCNTPFVAPSHLTRMPCVSCHQPFLRSEGLIVSSSPKYHFLINKDINEPMTFKHRLKWKKPNVNIHLITQYYKDSSPERQAEIHLCLKNNINNEYIDKIHLFFDNNKLELPTELQSEKINIIRFGKRLKFKDAFAYCNKELKGEICVVANSDIYFDHTLRYLLQLPISGKFLALSRVDTSKGVQLYFNEWTAPVSQDAWIFKSPLPEDIDADFYFGYLGCDNRIAWELRNKNWHVINPCLKIICRHVHVTEKRNYTQQDKVPGNYSPVAPTADF